MSSPELLVVPPPPLSSLSSYPPLPVTRRTIGKEYPALPTREDIKRISKTSFHYTPLVNTSNIVCCGRFACLSKYLGGIYHDDLLFLDDDDYFCAAKDNQQDLLLMKIFVGAVINPLKMNAMYDKHLQK
jgi:hypothetical protein